jgi:cysteine synthase A
MSPLLAADGVFPGLRLKIEYRNPSLSIKHRGLPPHIFQLASQGKVSRRSRLAILSAGSAGIAVTWAAQQLGCKASVFVPPGTPEIARRYMEWMGGEVHTLTPSELHTTHEKLRRDPNLTVIEQLSETSLAGHYAVVGRELARQADSIIAVLVGAGTAASLMGIGSVLRERGIRVFGVEPAEAPVLQGGAWSPHRIPGLAPPIPTALFDRDAVDGVLSVPSAAAWDTAQEVLRLTGEPIGPSSGACVHAAKELRKRLPEGEIVAVCSSSVITALVDARGAVNLPTVSCQPGEFQQ